MTRDRRPLVRTARDRPLRAAILRWYLANRRDLPWRRTRDPYAIWVSEIMLQQTRVETVMPYYERFLERFPDVRALAGAEEAEVLAAWSGLGYYGRARNLRAAAIEVVREHAGRLPRDRASLRALPGIGAYTAAAIESVAFDRPAAAVDGNVVRVLSRIEGLRGGRTAPALTREVAKRAEALASGVRPGDWTQALMELGATVCLPRAPVCPRCPAARWCVARARGYPERFPEPERPATPRAEPRVLLVARRRGRVLLVRATAAKEQAWSLPEARFSGEGAAQAAGDLGASLFQGSGWVAGPLVTFRHRTFSHSLSYEVWAVHGGGARRRGSGRWFAEASLSKVPIRAPTIKALNGLRELLEGDAEPRRVV